MTPPDGPRRVIGGSFGRAAGGIGLATAASRVLGYARDVLIATLFGAGPATDAFLVAFRIPNILRRLLAEGALSTAVVPVFAAAWARDPEGERRRLLRAVYGGALAVLVLATLVGILATPWLVALVAPGFLHTPGVGPLTILLARVMFPYLLLVGLSALAAGALQTEGRFFSSAAGPAVMNVGMMAGAAVIAAWTDPPILGLAVGVLLGGCGQLLVQIPDLARSGLLALPSWEPGHPALRRILRLLGPAAFGLAAVQVSVFVNTLLASLLPSGSVSHLHFADRVMELPLGVFAIALATAALPEMARQAAVADRPGVARTVGDALRLACFVCVPATVGLLLLGRPIVRVLFEGGAFGPGDSRATAAALVGYAIGLVGIAGARIVSQAFYAVGTPGTAVGMGFLGVGINLVAAVLLMRPLGHVALALATSIGAWAQALGLVLLARRRVAPIDLGALARSVARTATASGPVALWCWAALVWWPAGLGRGADALWLAGTIGGALATFAGGARLCARDELQGALRALLPGRAR